MYDPALGKFLSRDLIPGSENNTQDFNGYAYVRNGPLRYTDPSGWTMEEMVVVGQRWRQDGGGRSLLTVGSFSAGRAAPRLEPPRRAGRGVEPATDEQSSDEEEEDPTTNCLAQLLPSDVARILGQSADLRTAFLDSPEKAFDLGRQLNVRGFIDRVLEGRTWDFKNLSAFDSVSKTERDYLGNFAFGVTTSYWAAGATGGLSWYFPNIRTDFAQRGAGAYQVYKGLTSAGPYDRRDGTPLDWPGSSYYGDAEADFNAIMKGSLYAQSTRHCGVGK